MEILNIGKRREFFWDDTLVDLNQTTAEFRIHHPERQQPVMCLDKPWECDNNMYSVIIKDGDLYRMYYHAAGTRLAKNGKHDQLICYAESYDGLSWNRPSLGVCEYNGSTDNNIVIIPRDAEGFDGGSVVYDPRPECPPDERYKCLVRYSPPSLWCYISPDGKRFKLGWKVTERGYFDSLNTVIWDGESGRFRIFLRDFHRSQTPHDPHVYRDIRMIESEDFHNWSEPVLLHYSVDNDCQMYTNGVLVYPRAPHVLIALAGRYTERDTWTPNYDELCGRELRKKRMELSGMPRVGLAVTDTIFMTSRDSKSWTRYDEALVRQGPENPFNWVYGGSFMTVGLIETPDIYPGSDNVYSLYAFNKRFSGEHSMLDRYTMRLDGFVSQHAGARVEKLVTKPFIFDGSELYINFATSSAGFVKITVRALDGYGQCYCESCELFGDRCDRRVTFTDCINGDSEINLSDLARKPVFLDIRLYDADIYSFRFA